MTREEELKCLEVVYHVAFAVAAYDDNMNAAYNGDYDEITRQSAYEDWIRADAEADGVMELINELTGSRLGDVADDVYSVAYADYKKKGWCWKEDRKKNVRAKLSKRFIRRRSNYEI